MEGGRGAATGDEMAAGEKKSKKNMAAAAAAESHVAKKRKKVTAVDQAARKLLVEAAMTVEEYGAGRAPAYDAKTVGRVLAEGPAQCTLSDGDQAPPIVTAAAYGAQSLVSSMIEHAGAAAVDATDADGRYTLSWAAAFDCGDGRTCCQPCGGAGGQCGLRAKIDGCFCILGCRREGKLAVVKLLGPRSSAAAVEQAIDTAKAVRASFQADVDYHRQDFRENQDEDEEDEEDEEADEDVQVAEDNLLFAESLVAALEDIARARGTAPQAIAHTDQKKRKKREGGRGGR